MAKYSMPVLESICAASKTGAETLDIAHLTGELALGKQADIVVVSGNLLEDIGAVEQVVEVYFGGKPVYRA